MLPSQMCRLKAFLVFSPDMPRTCSWIRKEWHALNHAGAPWVRVPSSRTLRRMVEKLVEKDKLPILSTEKGFIFTTNKSRITAHMYGLKSTALAYTDRAAALRVAMDHLGTV